NPVSPSRQQSVADHSLVGSHCRVCLCMNRFRVVDQFMFSVVLCQIAECDAPPRVHFVDVEVESLDFSPRVAFLRKILDQPNRDLAFDTLAVGFSSLTKEQYPGLSVRTAFPFQPTALIPLRHCRLSFRQPTASPPLSNILECGLRKDEKLSDLQ